MKEVTKEHHPLYEELCSIIGPEYVSDEEFVRRSYTRAASYGMMARVRGKTPGIAVRPGSTEEISEIVKLANKTRTPVVPKGGGGSISIFPPFYVGTEENILIDTTRINKILEIDEDYMTVTTECGIILSRLSSEVRKKGFHLYTTDVPVHMDTVGGVLSGFIGGGEPSDLATSGVMNRYVLGLKVVLPTGDIIQTGSGPGTNIHQNKVLHREAGTPDMTGMFIGDGGSFGIKTEATFTIRPFPSSYLVGVYDMGTSFENLWKAFSKLVATDPFPYTRLLVFHRQGGTWFMVYIIRGHTDEETGLKEKILGEICVSCGGEPAESRDVMELASSFSARDLSKSVLPKGAAMTYFGEALIPRLRTREYLDDLNSMIDKVSKDLGIVERADFIVPYLRAMTITGVLLYLSRETQKGDRSERLFELMATQFPNLLLEKFGGFTESAQGESALLNASVWSPTYKSYMKTLKKALDPNNILMPDLWGLGL